MLNETFLSTLLYLYLMNDNWKNMYKINIERKPDLSWIKSYKFLFNETIFYHLYNFKTGQELEYFEDIFGIQTTVDKCTISEWTNEIINFRVSHMVSLLRISKTFIKVVCTIYGISYISSPRTRFWNNILKNLNLESYNVCIFTMFYKS